MPRILIVDDEANILKSLRRLLAMTPCTAGGKIFPLTVDTFEDPAEALENAFGTPYHLVLSDYRMPGMDGVAFLKEFRELQPNAARLILSGYADLNGLIAAINEAGILRFIAKPWNDYELVTTIAQALALQELQNETQSIADEARLKQGRLSPEDFERQRLEALEPGITRVHWGPDGSVMLDPDALNKD
ncbi:MAG: Hydrogenase transcriptional regulatory protein hupR1 [Candidatus Accumulibacter appositus]|uniref:Hydrogenase transcriptional regulatory protein hupR1 n=1 Tax=Candidatus Accumulibacter appositus TaxID=1454003 RepID=A0A011NQK2_9PROT|nr:response regulator [Accumulibacter sp.]EXI77591.1 MAG: Hydrogenase transcriptional regulatory protein hupR1 [Candidatus Accumulibacter appositus]HRF03953.1 response regulator [Accumulibacter sp.]